MPSIRLELTPETIRYIDLLKGFPKLFERAVEPSVDEAVQMLAGAVAEDQLHGDPLNVRSGTLSKSIASRVDRQGNSITASVGVLQGPAVAYGYKHEVGGEIKAKPGKALAVPLQAAMTPSGRPKYPKGPREAEERHPGEIVFLKRDGKGKGKQAKKGPPLICRVKRVAGSKKGREARLIPLFVLLKRVEIPGTHWLTKGIELNKSVFEVTFARGMKGRLGKF